MKGLRDFLISKGFKIGKVDPILFTRSIDKNLFVCQIYVDDIIFGSTNPTLWKEFGEMMAREFEMSMIGELNFFLGFQIKQRDFHPSRKIYKRYPQEIQDG